VKRSTLALLGVLVFLLAFIFGYDVPRRRQRALEERFLPFEKEEITSIAVSSDRGVWELLSADGKWRVSSDLVWPADEVTVNLVLEGLGMSKKSKVEGVDLKALGLQSPVLEASISSRGQRLDLKLGLDNPITGQRYALIGSKAYLVSGALLSDLRRSFEDVASKSILEDSVVLAVRFRLSRGGEDVLALSRDEDRNWLLLSGDRPYMASQARAADLIWRVFKGPVERFERASLEHPPALSVEVSMEDGSSRAVEYLASGDRVYARRANPPAEGWLLRLPEAASSDLASLSPSALLPQNPLEDVRYLVERFEVKGEGLGELSVVRSGDLWFVESRDVSPALERLLSLKASSVEEGSLSGGVEVLAISPRGERRIRVVGSRLADESYGLVYNLPEDLESGLRKALSR